MKNKIKIVSVLLVLTIIIPQIALASWWNPFSWNMFKKITPIVEVQKTEIVNTQDDKIVELQKQISELKNQVIPVKTTSGIKEVKKVAPIQVAPVIVPVITPIIVKDFCPNIDGVQAVFPSGYTFDRVSGKCISDAEVEAMDRIESDKRVIQVKEDNCDNAKEILVSKNKERTRALAKYQSDKEALKENAWAETQGLYNYLETNYRPIDNRILLEINTAQAEVQLYCN